MASLKVAKFVTYLTSNHCARLLCLCMSSEHLLDIVTVQYKAIVS